MSLRSLSLIILLLMTLGCSKDKYQTKPSLKIKKVSTTDVKQGQNLVFTFEYTDKEGDLAGTPVYVMKIVPDCGAANFKDSGLYLIPGDLPRSSNQKGELQVTLNYVINGARCSPRADTATYRFWLKDKAGNSSDTISSPKITIH